MQQPATTSLFQAATSTFESLALLFPEPGSVEGAEFVPLAATVSIAYRGAGMGRVVVGVTAGILPALAENMLGAAAAPDSQIQRDALGELANVVAGNVLPLVNGAAAVYRLDAPADAGDAPFDVRDGEVRQAFTRLQMDEGDALVALFSEGSATGVPASAVTGMISA
jgi:CheY-specific phosphatase CheX